MERIIRVRFSLLSELWCVAADVTDAEASEKILGELAIPGCSLEAVADRCVGGLGCEHPDRRHVFVDAGRFSYTSGDANGRLEPEERATLVREIVDGNPDPVTGYIGGGPFTSDIAGIMAPHRPNPRPDGTGPLVIGETVTPLTPEDAAKLQRREQESMQRFGRAFLGLLLALWLVLPRVASAGNGCIVTPGTDMGGAGVCTATSSCESVESPAGPGTCQDLECSYGTMRCCVSDASTGDTMMCANTAYPEIVWQMHIPDDASTPTPIPGPEDGSWWDSVTEWLGGLWHDRHPELDALGYVETGGPNPWRLLYQIEWARGLYIADPD